MKSDVPPGKKKHYPYQDARLFMIQEGKTSSRGLDRRGCWFCGHTKYLTSELETTAVMNYAQVKINFMAHNCASCGVPEFGRCSMDWLQGQMFLSTHSPCFRKKWGQKWNNRKAKLENELRQKEREILRLKEAISAIK